ncbi:HEAT repeat domain-containing protein [soil metagenome]
MKTGWLWKGGRAGIVGLGLVPLLLLATPSGAEDPPGQPGGFTPEEARDRMVLPDGFQAGIFASEPEVRQPVAATFDERGRLWVVEYLQYPNPEGLNPVRVDVYLRTEYDRVPEPPPHGPKGADRIKILEDTNGDGVADKVTTFVEGLNLASGVAVGHGGVFVAQAPYLLFYPDEDGDDVPDGDPKVLLKGFGLEDAHAVVNSLMWGPDGWLYGAQGSTVTADIRGIGFQQGIWRYHVESDTFELFAEGGGNTWGLDFDRAGHAFGSSNGAHIVFHMVQGGYYHKTFGKHGPLHNPRTFGYFEAIDYEGAKPGGHVTPGGLIYKGGAFPPEFDQVFIGANLLSNTVYWHPLKRRGSSFSGRYGGTLLDSRDFWFRPVAQRVGPDGAVYVVDWYDRRASHLDPRDNWDRSNGRIYRIAHEQGGTVEPFDLSKLSSRELVALRDHENDWYPAMARRLLAERRDPEVIPILQQFVREGRDEVLALRDLWALHVSGGLDDATALEFLEHPLPDVRRWVIRLLGDDHRMNDPLRDRLLKLAREEPDADTRSQLASSARRWEPDAGLPILGQLFLRDEDLEDPHIPLLIWWGLEHHMHPAQSDVVHLVTTSEALRAPIVVEVLLERVARALATGGESADYEDAARLFSAAGGSTERVDRLVSGLEKGLEGRRLERVPPPLAEALDRLWDQGEPGEPLIRLAVRLGSDQAHAEAIARALDPARSAESRSSMIELLGQGQSPADLDALLTLFRREEPAALQLAVLNALGGFRGEFVAETLLDRYPNLGGSLRSRVLDLLTRRPEWASRLLDVLGPEQVIDPKDLKASHAIQLAQLGDPALIERMERLWGRVPGPSTPDKTRQIAEVRGMLVEGDRGVVERGQLLFREHCAGCHKLFGEGEEIGPDLTGIDRGLDFLLESLVNPSFLIRKEYQAQTLALADGRILTGMIVEETGDALTLFDSQQQRIVLPLDAVEAVRAAETSLMPEGLLETLSDGQVRDLFRYLRSAGPPSP